MSQKSADLNGTLVLSLMFSAVYCHQPQQRYFILNLHTKCIEENTLPKPKLSVNDCTIPGPIKQHATGTRPESVHDSTPLSPFLPAFKLHTFLFETDFEMIPSPSL
jgi:hypothetical protein